MIDFFKDMCMEGVSSASALINKEKLYEYKLVREITA